MFGLCPWSAELVGAIKKRVWGRFYMTSTVSQVADSGALLLGMHFSTRVGHTFVTVWEMGESS